MVAIHMIVTEYGVVMTAVINGIRGGRIAIRQKYHLKPGATYVGVYVNLLLLSWVQ